MTPPSQANTADPAPPVRWCCPLEGAAEGRRGWFMSGRTGPGGFEALFAGELEARGDHQLVGAAPHRRAERPERCSRPDDRDRALVEHLRMRRANHFGLDHM